MTGCWSLWFALEDSPGNGFHLIQINYWRLRLIYLVPMIETKPVLPAASGGGSSVVRRLPSLPLAILQPILRRIVHKVAAENPDMFGRLGPHVTARFLIDPSNMPFMLFLCPDPKNLSLRAVNRREMPDHDARVSGKFLDLLRLIDGDLDGDALFFSRELSVTGNTEAVVCLRNALDDVEGSIAEDVAGMFGPFGRIALSSLRKIGTKPRKDTP